MNHRKAKILKTTSLVTLTLQNSILSLSMRYSRTRQKNVYYATTAVLMAELIKLVTCLIILFFEEGRSFKKLINSLDKNIIKQPLDTLKICVVSLIYVVQNNLIYISASHLDAATYQVTYQLKILTTAVFAVLILKRSLSAKQWLALVILVIGVVLVQLTGTTEKKAETSHVQNKWIGFGAVLTACVLSGFSGIYFEMILKASNVSVWMRNIQLSFLSLPFGLFTCFSVDYEKIMENGFFYKYDFFVIFVILLQACGGLIVALVVKYADNILKGFATSLSIIISSVASIYLLGFQVTLQFVAGAILVIGSIFLYNAKTAKGKIPVPTSDSDMDMAQKV